MKTAVLSGKGGTGKTFVAVNIAYIANNSTYIDCDVEEPNGHLFFSPNNLVTENVSVLTPCIDNLLCNGCRTCVDFCKFNALAYIGKVIVMDKVCHSCGGCTFFCPNKAIKEVERDIGTIQKGTSGDIQVISGILNIGEVTGVPIIKKLVSQLHNNKNIIIDCPPGTACTATESIKDADFCLLVAEDTAFGIHNLKMVYELVKLFSKPHGVLINKCFDGINALERYCIENNVPVIGKIKYDEKLAQLNSRALIAAKEDKKYYEIFTDLYDRISRSI